MTIAKKQHHVFRYYLEPWGIGRSKNLFCYSIHQNKVFKANTKNVAVEHYFYKYPILNENDMNIINFIVISLIENSTEYIHETAKFIVNHYKERSNIIYEAKKRIKFFEIIGTSLKSKDFDRNLKFLKQKLSNHEHEGLENRYCHAEQKGITGLNALRSGDLSFWENDLKRDEFCYYLTNQYFRTKTVRNNIGNLVNEYVSRFEEIRLISNQNSLNIQGISQVICDVMELKLEYSRIFNNKKISLVVNETSIPFITSDHPIVNLLASGNKVPIDFELYYPITPTKAILLRDKNTGGNDVTLTENKANYYNKKIYTNSNDQIYSNNQATLFDINNSI